MFGLVVVIVVVVVLISLEYVQHDCINGKKCLVSVEPPKETDTPKESVIVTIDMLKRMYSYSFWRQALLVALIVTIPVILIAKKQMPGIFEFLIVCGIIFIAVYFSYSWMWTHFIFPSSQKIESSLRILSRKI